MYPHFAELAYEAVGIAKTERLADRTGKAGQWPVMGAPVFLNVYDLTQHNSYT